MQNARTMHCATMVVSRNEKDHISRGQCKPGRQKERMKEEDERRETE